MPLFPRILLHLLCFILHHFLPLHFLYPRITVLSSGFHVVTAVLYAHFFLSQFSPLLYQSSLESLSFTI